MSELNKPSTWVEGEAKGSDLINALVSSITSAQLKALDGTPVLNKWAKVASYSGDLWVNYKQVYATNTVANYTHTDGKKYPIYKMNNLTELKKGANSDSYAMDSNGNLTEYSDILNGATGKKIQVRDFTYTYNGTTVKKLYDQILITFLPDANSEYGWTAWILDHKYPALDGTVKIDVEWDDFQIVAKMPTDWSYFYKLTVIGGKDFVYDYYVVNTTEYTRKITFATALAPYKFTKRSYTPELKYEAPLVVVKATPDKGSQDYFVVLSQPIDFNYIDVQQGVGFKELTQPVGDATLTYTDICEPDSVRLHVTPVIIDMVRAEDMYYRLNNLYDEPTPTIVFKPGMLVWEKDYYGNDVVSPPAHWFYAKDSTVSWLKIRKRRPEYIIRWWMAVNNDRVAIMLEGDPAPGIYDYYRSFGYIGKIVPFNDFDHQTNFGVTVGMGELNAQTGFTANDIKENSNPIYAGYGEYTSNGMYSFSMLGTKGNVYFQSYYPAFLTQLPNYPSVGTIPSNLSRLVLDKDRFQSSSWTKHYHASPVYMVHRSEGYRGYLDGIVGIHDHNLVNMDELIVDTEVLKDATDPSKGTWTEVYKFFKIKNAINLFKYSASTDKVTIAILKEIK